MVIEIHFGNEIMRTDIAGNEPNEKERGRGGEGEEELVIWSLSCPSRRKKVNYCQLKTSDVRLPNSFSPSLNSKTLHFHAIMFFSLGLFAPCHY